ncbi:MAG: helix-turn-helix transcriptional regulator [Clostridia bacterium]|nr:helix-turn-helix transcriptional regulator [Clostridia bacterium]MBR3591896.1 helix-turn-helix transcriptional regulator [Clostridia bacterium]MBR4116873.1 helix-turn-helix transcriptional regulator [Clostridia bacterium]
MELKVLGIDFPHKKGEFCHKTKSSFYTVCCFSTPFLYLKDDVLHRGNKGDILINTPENIVYHGPVPDSECGFINDWFHINGDDFTSLLKKYELPLNTAFNVGDNSIFRKYMNRLTREFSSNKIGAEDFIDAIITQLIISLHRAYTKINFYDESFEKIAVVKRAIVKNPQDNWCLKTMSELSGYSISRFSELYSNLYGISAMNDVLFQRIELAKRLLVSGQASVSYVSKACGFNTINYFSKFFKKSTGYTPKEYMNNFFE